MSIVVNTKKEFKKKEKKEGIESHCITWRQSGKSSVMSWPDIKRIHKQTNKQTR